MGNETIKSYRKKISKLQIEYITGAKVVMGDSYVLFPFIRTENLMLWENSKCIMPSVFVSIDTMATSQGLGRQSLQVGNIYSVLMLYKYISARY